MQQLFLMASYKIRAYVKQKAAGHFGIEVYIINPDKDKVNGQPWVKVEGLWHKGYETYTEALEAAVEAGWKIKEDGENRE